jgi:hypothetical protein
MAVGQLGEAGLAPGFSFDGGMRWGFTANDSATNGLSLGVQVPMIALLAVAETDDGEWTFWRLLNFDGFIATTTADDLNFSFGLTGSSFHAMPYLQLGRFDRWYTTQAVMFINETDSWMWAPSFTSVKRNKGTTATHVTLTGAVGKEDNEVFWMAGVTIMFEFMRARN